MNKNAYLADIWPSPSLTVKYHGPTTHRGSRLSAEHAGVRVSQPRDYSKSVQGQMLEVAVALADELGWAPLKVQSCCWSSAGALTVLFC